MWESDKQLYELKIEVRPGVSYTHRWGTQIGQL
jgi:hypothetical protein